MKEEKNVFKILLFILIKSIIIMYEVNNNKVNTPFVPNNRIKLVE